MQLRSKRRPSEVMEHVVMTVLVRLVHSRGFARALLTAGLSITVMGQCAAASAAPEMYPVLMNAVESTTNIVVGTTIARQSYWEIVPDSVIYTEVMIRVDRTLRGHASGGDMIHCEYLGGAIGRQYVLAPYQFTPVMGDTCLFFLSRCQDGSFQLEPSVWSACASLHGANAWFPDLNETVSAAAVLDTIGSMLSRDEPASLTARADLAVRGEIHLAERSGFPPGIDVLDVLSNSRAPDVHVGSRLKVGDLPRSWWSGEGRREDGLDGSILYLFLVRRSNDRWEPLPTRYAWWRPDGDSVRVGGEGTCGQPGPSVLSTLDVASFRDAILRASE
jgi:hypothetical protein